jgi:hypothetical protein
MPWGRAWADVHGGPVPAGQAEPECVAVVARVPGLARPGFAEGLRQPVGRALPGPRGPCAEGDQVAFGVLVPAFLLANLLRGPVGEHSPVRQERERARRSAAGVDRVGGLVDGAVRAGHDRGAVSAGAGQRVGEHDQPAHSRRGGEAAHLAQKPRLLAERGIRQC